MGKQSHFLTVRFPHDHRDESNDAVAFFKVESPQTGPMLLEIFRKPPGATPWKGLGFAFGLVDAGSLTRAQAAFFEDSVRRRKEDCEGAYACTDAPQFPRTRNGTLAFLYDCAADYLTADKGIAGPAEIPEQEEKTPSLPKKPEHVVQSLTIHGFVGKVFVQQAQNGSNTLMEQAPQKSTPRSAWRNGAFYLFALAIIVAASITVAAFHISPWLSLAYCIPLLLLVGALQLRHDDRLSENAFIKMVRLILAQLPFLGRLTGKKD
jgi:hypothetical protein